jgi:hypothetical protein
MVSPRDLVVLVNYQLMLGWGLNRQVSWHFTLKDTIDIAGRAAHQSDRHNSVGDRPAVGLALASSPRLHQPRRATYCQAAQFVPTSLRRYGASNYTKESAVEIL